METAVTTFLGRRLRIDLERLITPSGVVVTHVRPAGLLITSERRTIVSALLAAGRLGGQFMVLDVSEIEGVDHTGVGEILLLHGRMRLANRHFSLVTREGTVADYLRRYGVLEIIKVRRPAMAGLSGFRAPGRPGAAHDGASEPPPR